MATPHVAGLVALVKLFSQIFAYRAKISVHQQQLLWIPLLVKLVLVALRLALL